ncbi:MAG: hypothetical protein CME60_00190 [Halobacteriovoraceae bacterium]|nr:hypothetical protein [Halobacteriovoraceae bacterium]
MFIDHWGSWLLLILFISALIYTLIVVKEEKTTFLENAKPMSFHEYSFHYPSWWGLTLQEEKLLKWERTDTRYDWAAHFFYEENLNQEISIEEDFKNRIEEMKIVFDLEASDIRTPEDFKIRESFKSGDLEIVRIEGTATQAGIERRYLDAFLVRNHREQSCLFATSLSSVLNGLVEGPYFEEMMFSLKLK